MKRQERLERVREIERELHAARYAAELLESALEENSGLLAEESFGVRDFRIWREKLDGTYLIRMFAEFEAGLRDVWVNHFKKPADKHVPVRDLIESIGKRQQVRVRDDVIDGVHATRRARNALVHEGHDNAVAVEFAAARTLLGEFLSRLPKDW